MTKITRRQMLRFGAAASAGAAFCNTTSAQAMPETARIIVGFPAGGSPDLICRRLAERLTGKLARVVVVDNRPGASGRIAYGIARQAPADGQTLLLNGAGMLAINPHIYSKLNYDPFKDFAPLSLAAIFDFGFAVGPGVPAEVTSFAEFTARAKANRGRVSYGSPGAGTPPHFVGDAINRRLGLGMVHVPYRGGPPALTDMAGGQLSAAVLSLGDLVAQGGRSRVLAVTGPSRSRFAAQVPTFAEQNVPGLDRRTWFGVYIAGKPAPALVSRVAPIVKAALGSREYVLALNNLGMEAAPGSPQDLDRLGRADLAYWGPIVKASGFQADS
jgi:tripartite-type tricarboxylate transporter receptor subunit TctC